jgi:hypothetical protein
MKVTVTRLEVERCGGYLTFLEVLKGKGIDVSRPYSIRGNVVAGDFEVTQGDERKDRSGSGEFGYCWGCKEVVELAGEHCSECETWLGENHHDY